MGPRSAGILLSEKILNQAELNIRPLEAITRAEVAQMLFNLLSSANLL